MNRRLPGVVAILMLALGAAPWALAQAGGGGAATGPATVAKMEAMAAANKGALVVVEYQLQYDKGNAPQGSGFEERCPFCGQYHAAVGFEEVVREERALERAGVLVDATHVVTDDLQLHPRFVKSIKVRAFGGENAGGPRVDATISAYPKEQNAVIVELSGPLAGVKAASFDAQRAGPYTVLHLGEAEGRWVIGLRPMAQDLVVRGGKSYVASSRGLVVDKDGAAVGMTTGLEVPADGTWKGNPMQWPAFSSGAMKELMGKVQGRVDKGIVPVTLNFRSPKNNGARDRYSSRGEEDATVQHVLGVFTDPKTVLVLANLKATATSRLERIRVMTEPPMDAKFVATLADYGALVAKTETAASGMPGLSTADLVTLRGAALPSADVLLQGENRVTYLQERRIAGLNVGFRGNLYPQLPDRDGNMFLFDAQGDLLALPLAQREKASTESRYSYSEERGQLTSIAPVKKALADLGANSDTNNVPLSEDQEGRLAWLGFELQPLTKELARANNVADQTQDGESGALVTFVYPDSPAAKAGVEMGWVLLRVDVEGQPKPIDVRMESDRMGDEPFPWDRLDSAPETVFDSIPTPWPSAENSLLRALTDIGFGKKFVAEFAHDKKVDKKDFTVVQGPATYNNAPKYKSAGLGITVRDMTYEVRRYMQKKDDDPGVIIGKIEMGSKASVAGLKPYEVITHVNDQPVMNVKDFENASKDLTELRLSVKRMTTGRIVKITLPKADSAATGGSKGP